MMDVATRHVERCREVYVRAFKALRDERLRNLILTPLQEPARFPDLVGLLRASLDTVNPIFNLLEDADYQ